MARRKTKPKKAWRETIGLLMQAVWVLLLLALASYTWRDIPWECSPCQSPTANYIGPVGAWSAWVVFKVFGLAGFLVPLLLAVWGLIMLFQSGERIWPRVLWMTGILLGVSVLLDLQVSFWSGVTAERFNLDDLPGGLSGYFLGRQLLTNFLGVVGSVVISLGVILSGLFFVAQTHPAELWAAWGEWRERWRARREEIAASRRSAEEEAERQAKKLERERAKLEKELARERRLLEKEERRLQKEREQQERAAERQREIEERLRLQKEAAEERAREEEARKAAFQQRVREQEQQRREAERRAAEAQAQAKAAAAAQAAAANGAARQEGGAAADGTDAKPPQVWQLPPMTLLQPVPPGAGAQQGPEELEKTIHTIQATLAEFGIEAEVTHVERGPVVTRYELLPAAGVKVERIAALSNNLTLALKAESIRVQAPIPGKGVVGIEVPNQARAPVVLRQLLESAAWNTTKAALPLALGQDVGGHVLLADLAGLPHLLIAGATGQGKTVCMNSILAGLLMTRTPDELGLILIDPKIVEFSTYNDLPHLLTPVITEAKKVVSGLRIAIQEMERRFKLFHRANVRDIRSFNQRPKVEQQDLFGDAEGAEEKETAEDPLPERLPYWVIIIDELADLMLMAQQEIEPQIQKLTQLARATGIHMIIATQRPTVDIITGTIKSNIPGRVAFKVAQKNDSRVVIDQEGADKLVGRGDMLVLSGANKLVRAQGAWTKDAEIQAIVDHWKAQGKPRYDNRFAGKDGGGGGVELPGVADEDDELIQQAIEVIRQTRRASTSAIQRRLRIGYTRAARVMDVLEERGMVGPTRGAEPREILFDIDGLAPMEQDGADDDGA